MKRLLALLILILSAHLAAAQTDIVTEGELSLTVTVEPGAAAPYVGELVLVTIHGRYTRHIARESLAQPELDGFSWMQLGYDYWYDTTVRGKKVKNFRRRMALFPQRAGRLTIAPYIHKLDLIDSANRWFPHEIRSSPVTIEVLPAPAPPDRWLPLKRLEISDQWSNAPDQLAPGAGVLRVIRVEATGIAPEMLPPMPDLTSPSGDIFPHPEKRLVELSPDGPVAIAFWRWTIRPSGPVSAIVEPFSLDYYDTLARVPRRVTISPTRVAYAEAAPAGDTAAAPPVVGRLHRGAVLGGLGAGLVLGLGGLLAGRALPRPAEMAARLRLRAALRHGARSGDLAALRRAAAGLDR
ncbi:MAG: hypothetical protein ACP5EN_15305, partial [Rhodovulum sp.]